MDVLTIRDDDGDYNDDDDDDDVSTTVRSGTFSTTESAFHFTQAEVRGLDIKIGSLSK